MQAGFRPESILDEAQDEYEEEKEFLKEEIASKYGIEEEKLDH